MKRNTIFSGLVVLVTLCLVIFAYGENQNVEKQNLEKKEPIIDSQVKEVQGEISYITKRSISVVFNRDKETGSEEEILLPFDSDEIVIEHKRNLSEIQPGDTVLVRYLDETIDYGDKKENTIKAKVIRFLRPAGEDSPYKRKAASEQQEAGMYLPLKGAK
ncbi:MAG: hypothetical protein N2606_04885 [Candidatus Omnitrophica bacterium]|nr:hypothetical protein [Candidatus Omnitrophota bacterium]